MVHPLWPQLEQRDRKGQMCSDAARAASTCMFAALHACHAQLDDFGHTDAWSVQYSTNLVRCQSEVIVIAIKIHICTLYTVLPWQRQRALDTPGTHLWRRHRLDRQACRCSGCERAKPSRLF